MKRLLIQTQLSNYDTKGKFILECDSGWQMVMGRVREMLARNPDLKIDVMGPYWDLDGQNQLITSPWELNEDLFNTGRLRYVEHWVQPNALETRYDFDFEGIAHALNLEDHKKHVGLRYDAIYINDPMHLRNFKALFMLKGGYRPRYYVHSHFVDVPECPKFPTEASLWLGQCEAALKADYNFWQCESAMLQFFDSMGKWFTQDVVDDVRAKSMPWDDGYSAAEITSPVDEENMRFTPKEFREKVGNKVVLFVPNRIGGKGRSSDYTNCGKFMFDILPELRKRRDDFVVVCGNPSQKIFNHELEEWCGKDGYVSLVKDAFNRDEFKFVARHSDIALALYDQDAYGGTAARECVELGCVPLWIDNYEYSSLAREANVSHVLAKADFSDLVDKACELIDMENEARASHGRVWDGKRGTVVSALRKVVQATCSYEATTPAAMGRMGLL
jgi:hypothetical protein